MFKPLTLSLIFSLSALGSLTSAHAGDPVADTVLVSYGNVSPAPVIVRGSLVEGKDGSLYGVSQNGGLTGGYGTVFRVPPGGGGLTLLHSFGGPDGNDPEHALAIDAKGVLYGTTYGGGAGSPACGTVFSLTPAGVFKTLHTFRCDDSGGAVDSNVVFGADGFLYGTTNYGPTRDGLVFRIARNGSQFSVVANFNTTGSGEAFGTPVGGLMPGQDGSFYGMAL
jgi:uncharacterized repeat protein (TIGR03803 family)